MGWGGGLSAEQQRGGGGVLCRPRRIRDYRSSIGSFLCLLSPGVALLEQNAGR